MSRSKEHNRIYIDSAYSGIGLGYIEVTDDKAIFTSKTQIQTKSSSSFLSFHKADTKYFQNITTASTTGKVDEITGSSTQSYTIDYPHDLCVDNYDTTCDTSNSCDTVTAKTRYFTQQSVKTVSVFFNNKWYFPVIEAARNKCANYSIDYILKVYHRDGSSISSAIGDQCAGRQFAGYASSAFVFEFGEDLGKIISFSGMNRGFAKADKESYINYKVLVCDAGSCSVDVDAALHGDTNETPGGGDFLEKTHVISVKQDSSNPLVFFVRALYNDNYFNEMIEFAADGTIANRHDVSESYGFSVNIGLTSIGGTDYDLYLMAYFDREYNRYRVGLKASDTAGVILRSDEGSPLAFDQDQFKVTHNGGSTLAYPNSFFYSSTTYQTCMPGANYCDSTSGTCTANLTDCSLYLNLTSAKSLRVSATLPNKDLKDEAKCGDAEDYLLVGDFFYYCVSSCLDYFNSLTMKASGVTHTCENKIVFTDFGKTNHRCVTRFVDNASNCPDLSFTGSDNYKFKYTSGDYIEYRYDCRDEYILKPTGDTIVDDNTETGTCGTCDYATKKLLETSNHMFFDDSGVKTAVRRKYCLDDCDIAPFLNKYIVDDGGTLKQYCAETCIAANSITDIPAGNSFSDPDSPSKECRSHCDPARNHVTSATNSSSIAAILVEPICKSACPTTHRAHEASFTDPSGTVVTHIYCLDTCTVEDKLFTVKTGDDKECVTACPSNLGFHYEDSAADPKMCSLKCPASHPNITGSASHTGPASEITTGICKAGCDDPNHFRHETLPGVFLCLEACLPERPFISTDRVCVSSCSAEGKVVRPFPGIISIIQHDSTTGGCEADCTSTEFKYDIEINGVEERLCLPSRCHTDKAFFDTDRVCEPECPTGKKYLQLFSGIISTITYNSAEGLCGSTCPNTTDFKYMSTTNTCFNCPGTCTEADIDTRTDNIYANGLSLTDLNNGCTRVHCLTNECYSDKGFFTAQRICHSDCPDKYKHLNTFTGIIATITHDSIKGLCSTDCPANYYKYMSSSATCTETDIANRIDAIQDPAQPTIDVSDLNNGCARVHCLATECHTDKGYFTPDLICLPDCPIRYRHLNPKIGIIDKILVDSTKGLCDDDCPANHYKYMPSSATCTETDIANRVDTIHDPAQPTIDVSDLNNGCAKVYCLEDACHTGKEYFTPDLICLPDCPIRYRHLNPKIGIIDTITVDSTKGLCDDDCPAGHYKYMKDSTECTGANIATRVDEIQDPTKSFNVNHLNDGCAKVYCLATECHTDKGFFTPDLICLPDCPIRYRHINPETGIINKIEHDSTKGKCDDNCPANHYKYMKDSDACTAADIATRIDNIQDPAQPTIDVSDLNNGCTQVFCLEDECHTDKGFFTPDLICQPECPIRYRHINPKTGIINKILIDSTKGLCDTDCPANHYKYMKDSDACTGANIATRIDNIQDPAQPTIDVSDLNNGCTQVFCLEDACHTDKEYFTPDLICQPECPTRYKHLQSKTGIINTIEHDSTKGLCDTDCPNSTDFKYTNPTTTCVDCPDTCTEEVIAQMIDEIHDPTNPKGVEELNNGCTRVHCIESECHSDKPFFTPDLICQPECPLRYKHLSPYTNIINEIGKNSTKGLCADDCPDNTFFKYTNPSTTCTDCPFECSEQAISDRIDNIYLGNAGVDDLNNGCTRVHCIPNRCPNDKPFFTGDKVCVPECPLGAKHVQPFTGIIDPIEINSTEGMCMPDCLSDQFKYTNPGTTCLDCPTECTEEAIVARINNIYLGNATAADMNNGCTRLHCLPDNCPDDKPFFTADKICVTECPEGAKHVQPFTGIINSIKTNSKKGMCMPDCLPTQFKYLHPSKTCKICTSTCSQPFLDELITEIYLGTKPKTVLNTNCTRTHCLTGECPEESSFFTSDMICIEDCPSGKKHLQTFTGVLNTVEQDSNKGFCAAECANPTDWKYVDETKTCTDCDGNCNTAAILTILDQVESGTQPLSFANTICTRLHCMTTPCSPPSGFFSANRICYFNCPDSIKFVRKYPGIIDQMQPDSQTGLCSPDCIDPEFKYAVHSTNQQIVCLDRCHDDKGYWDLDRYCHSICPTIVPYVNPEDPNVDLNIQIKRGICKSECDTGLEYIYETPTSSGRFYCLKSCDQGKEYFIRRSNAKECLAACPIENKFIHPLTKECLVVCPTEYKYYNENWLCMEKCDDKINEWMCAKNCPAELNYAVEQSCSALCPNNLIGWPCSPFCPPGHPNQVNRYCALSCLNDQYLDEVVNFKQSNESGICRTVCNGFLIEGGEFFTGVLKSYCVPECPFLYLKEIRSVSEIWCREKCVRESIWMFELERESCVSSCADYNYPYVNEDYQCIESCSHYIDRDIWCVSECPAARPFVYNQHCVEECPGDAKFVEEFKFCVPKCELYNYDIFCVKECDDPILVQYYTDNDLEYRPLGFVHSNLQCAAACNEPGFEWINENNNHCVANCPLPCVDGVCPFPDMKFKEPTKYCREACNHKDYRFGDVTAFECFTDCKPERPYYVEEDRFCLTECPESKPKVFLKSACDGFGVCEPNCEKQHSVCVGSCPRQANYRMLRGKIEYCLCRCPEFYKTLPGTNVCTIYCDELKGLLPNQAGDDCDACKDEGLFLWEGECIRECPKSTLSNPFNSCRTCKQLGLWQDHNLACVKFHECSELSLFDYTNQICTRCDGEGMMVRKIFPGDFVCLKTNCSDGHVVPGIVTKCFVCPSGWFFFRETCFKTCPDGFFNDYARWICTENCFESCSENCCVNGTCTLVQGLSECSCKDGFFGEKCDIKQDSLEKTASAIQSALVAKLNDKLFSRADTNALVEFYFYAKSLINSRRQLLRVNPVLATNLRAFIEETRIKFAFQPEILGLIDSLLLIEKLGVLQTGETAAFESAVSLLDSLTDDIQIFLTQSSEVGDFERVFDGKFRGQAFSFSFGTDVTDASEVNVSKCLSRIRERDGLPYGTKFPFKLLRFSSEVASTITRELPHAFNLSSTGRFELTLFLDSGLYPLNEVCQENYVDTTEQVVMEPEKKQSSQKFANIGVNVFDITVPFFNDKCVPYQSEDGKDLTLKERKAKLYKDPSELCNESAAKVCSVDGFSPEGEAICICRGIQNQKKSSLQSIASTYPQTNYVLITCFETFRQSDIFRNVGFYIVFLSFVSFTSMGIKSIFQSDSEIHSLRRFRYVRNDVEFFDPDRMKIETYFENCYSLKERLSMHVIEIADKGDLFRSLEDDEKTALFKVLPTVCDLKHLSFDQLLEFDRRSHLQFAFDTFTERNILFNTFYMDSLVFPKYFRIMFFVTEFNLNITLNAFFIDDELVENFNEQEDTGFFYSMTNESVKTLWAFMTTKLVMTLFKGLYYVSSREASHLLRRMKSIEADYVKRAFNLFLLNTRVASLLFSFVVLIFNLLCAYFVIIFCEIFRNSIDIWINGIYMGWIFDYFVLGGIVPLLLVGSRYLSTKNANLSFLYKLSNLIDVMLSLGLN